VNVPSVLLDRQAPGLSQAGRAALTADGRSAVTVASSPEPPVNLGLACGPVGAEKAASREAEKNITAGTDISRRSVIRPVRAAGEPDARPCRPPAGPLTWAPAARDETVPRAPIGKPRLLWDVGLHVFGARPAITRTRRGRRGFRSVP